MSPSAVRKPSMSSSSRSCSSSNSVFVLITDWRSVFFIASVVIIDSIKITVVQMNSWPYLKSMDSNVDEEFYGVAKSALTLGTITASLASGYFSNYISHTKPSILAGTLLMLLCCILYANMEMLAEQWRKWAFLTLELLFGWAGGAIVLWRTQLAISSTDRDRQKATALVSIAFNLGFIIGPLIVLSTNYVFPSSLPLPWHAHLNIYTAPLYVQALIGLFSFGLLAVFFDGRMHGAANANARQRHGGKPRADIDGTERAPSNLAVPFREAPKALRPPAKLDPFAIFACFVARINFCAFILYLISLSSPYAMTVFGWSAVTGGMGLLISLGYSMRISSRLKERKCILFSLCLMLTFFVVSFPWPFLGTQMPRPQFRQNLSQVNETSTLVLASNGCDRGQYSWCDSTPAINVYVYHVALVLCFGLAMPVGQMNLDTLYSRMLGPIKQGTMQGIFFSVGESLILFGPPLINFAYQTYGPRPIWVMEILLFSFGIFLWLLCYQRLVPASESLKLANIRERTTKCGPLPSGKNDGGLLHVD
uniref:Uncharacterized protein n=1 Tax=Globodera rostochiensis TaxID=31243 RepID=A0A914I5H5_GLORO